VVGLIYTTFTRRVQSGASGYGKAADIGDFGDDFMWTIRHAHQRTGVYTAVAVDFWLLLAPLIKLACAWSEAGLPTDYRTAVVPLLSAWAHTTGAPWRVSGQPPAAVAPAAALLGGPLVAVSKENMVAASLQARKAERNAQRNRKVAAASWSNEERVAASLEDHLAAVAVDRRTDRRIAFVGHQLRSF
jgi:hypothetical protein